ncbi:MAG: S9 family peptidase [bacterium]|nr:S9 family peptidase [bacterium]
MKLLLTLCFFLFSLAQQLNAAEYTLSQYLNIQSASGGSFNPRGDELSYISNVSGQPQVWSVSSRSGLFSQMTFEEDGVDGAWWSPTDPTKMIVAASRGGSERSKLYMVTPLRSPLIPLTTTDNDAIYRFGSWSADGSRFSYSSNQRNGTDFDVFEYVLEDSASHLICEDSGHLSASVYSRDNRYMVIVRDLSNVNTDFLIYDRESQSTRVMTAHEGDEFFADPHFDDTGLKLLCLSNRGREYIGICELEIESGALEWIETPEQDIDHLGVAPDGLSYAYSVNDRGLSRFNFVNLRKDTRIGDYRFPEGIIRELSYSHDGRRIAITFGAANKPFDVWIYDTAGDMLGQLTHSATGGVPQDQFVTPELIEFESFDKLKVPAFWYVPKHATGKLPVIISIHGGPESQARPDLSGLYQYLLAQGYAILEPNVRGSSGFGRTYLTLDNVKKRMDSVKDIEYAAKWLSKQKNVDTKRIVLQGGSYGGFMVLAGLTSYPDLFAAGIDIVGISNFVTFLQNTGKYRKALREAEYGSLETDREFLELFSPVTHVDKIKAPLFVIQGANDPRVPQSESDQMVEAIRARGGTVEYMVFDDEGHGLRKTENKLEAYAKVAEFLKTHIQK